MKREAKVICDISVKTRPREAAGAATPHDIFWVWPTNGGTCGVFLTRKLSGRVVIDEVPCELFTDSPLSVTLVAVVPFSKETFLLRHEARPVCEKVLNSIRSLLNCRELITHLSVLNNKRTVVHQLNASCAN